MQKIMFNDKYGLTAAVLEGRKTMTWRLLPQDKIDGRWDYNSYYDYCLKCKRLGKNEITWDEWLILHHGKYKVGEVVAVAQPYKETHPNADFMRIGDEFITESAGWNNKMFVRADLMPHQIRITDIKVERLQDISDKDCIREGLWRLAGTSLYHYDVSILRKGRNLYHTPREAFAALIDKVSGNGTWKRNPWAIRYYFELWKQQWKEAAV